jgi:uncharacterized membrane protein
MEIYEFVLLFFVYAFLGWCSEVAFAAVTQGVFVNRGFLNGPLCPVYGFGLLAVILALQPVQDHLLPLFLGSLLLTTAIEFIAGFLLEKIFGARWWDYSDEPFNIKGYVCPRFSLLWGLACVFVIRLVHPPILGLLHLIPEKVGIILAICLVATAAVDLTATVLAVRSLKSRLRLITELAQEIHSISDRLGEPISEGALTAKERADQAKRRMEETRERMEEAKEHVDEWREKRLAKRKELYALLHERKLSYRRIVKAFPGLKVYHQEEALEHLKESYAQRREKRHKK